MSEAVDPRVAVAAGASTGLFVDVVLFPLDFLKTRIQGLPRSASTLPSTLTSNSAPPLRGVASAACVSSVSGVRQRGGVSSFYKGIGALALGSVPSSAIFFGVYEQTKRKAIFHLGLNCLCCALVVFVFRVFAEDLASPASSLAPLLSASIAELSACLFRNPFEVVKQQVQLGMHATTLRGFSTVYRKGGLKAFFVGFNAAAARDIPFAAIQLALWEEAKTRLSLRRAKVARASFCRSDEDAEQQGSRFAFLSGIAGMASGAVAAFVTTPMDVLKTRLMTLPSGSRSLRARDVGLAVWNSEGLRGFFSGSVLRVVWISLGGGLYLGGYDALKVQFSKLLRD